VITKTTPLPPTRIEVLHPRRPPSHNVLPQLIAEYSVGEQAGVVDLTDVHRTDLVLQPVSALVDEFGVLLGDSVGEPHLVATGDGPESKVADGRWWVECVGHAADPRDPAT